jgi:hypothetical protein
MKLRVACVCLVTFGVFAEVEHSHSETDGSIFEDDEVKGTNALQCGYHAMPDLIA